MYLEKITFFAPFLVAAIVTAIAFSASWVGTAAVIGMGIIAPILYLLFGAS